MTREDYTLIASVIRNLSPEDEELTPASVAQRFAKELARRNPNFKLHLFYRACGLSDDGEEEEAK